MSRGPEFFGKTKSLYYFLTSDYDFVHVKYICKNGIVKLSVVNNLWFSVIAVIHNELLFCLCKCIWDPINDYYITWSLIFDFCKATQTRDELNLGPNTITVGRLRLARCVASWSTAHSRFAFEFSPNMVTIGPLFRKSLGLTFKDGGQLKKEYFLKRLNSNYELWGMEEEIP